MRWNGARAGASGQVLVGKSARSGKVLHGSLESPGPRLLVGSHVEQLFTLFGQMAKSVGDAGSGSAGGVDDAEVAGEFFFKVQHGTSCGLVLIEVFECAFEKICEIRDGGGGFSYAFD